MGGSSQAAIGGAPWLLPPSRCHCSCSKDAVAGCIAAAAGHVMVVQVQQAVAVNVAQPCGLTGRQPHPQLPHDCLHPLLLRLLAARMQQLPFREKLVVLMLCPSQGASKQCNSNTDVMSNSHSCKRFANDALVIPTIPKCFSDNSGLKEESVMPCAFHRQSRPSFEIQRISQWHSLASSVSSS